MMKFELMRNHRPQSSNFFIKEGKEKKTPREDMSTSSIKTNKSREAKNSIKTIFRYTFLKCPKEKSGYKRPLKYNMDWSKPNKQILPIAKRKVRTKSYCPTILGVYFCVKNNVKPNKRTTPKTRINKVKKLCRTTGFWTVLSKWNRIVFNTLGLVSKRKRFFRKQPF